MRNFRLAGATAALCLFVGGSASALALGPGETLDEIDYNDFGEVLVGNPLWFGPSLGMFSASARETRDGFDGFEVIEDLYDVTGVIDVEVFRTTIGGLLTFVYDFSSIVGFSPGQGNGVDVFSVSGFNGYDVEIGWAKADGNAYIPIISRSGDGDTISVDFLDPGATWQCCSVVESILVRVPAPAFRLDGTGVVDINIDSFGVYPNGLSDLPNPSQVPLPVPAALLLGAIGMLGAQRLRKS